MRTIPKVCEVYEHFKGNRYEILAIAKHSETGEELVIYKALYGEGEVYARPLDMFLSPVDKEKYPDAKQEYRFEKVEESVDPEILEFLDADTTEEKLRILTHLRPKLTDQYINTLAASLDMEIRDGDIDSRYEELKESLMTRAKYEVVGRR